MNSTSNNINRIEKIIDVAKSIQPDVEIVEHHNQYTFVLNNSEQLILFLKEMKTNSDTNFDMLTDITAIDWLDKRTYRFEIVYFLYSNMYKQRIRIKVPVTHERYYFPTATIVYESANWYERETYDMYGIIFEGHPDLRRFYMPEDFFEKETGKQLHALRKDFPVMGIPDSLPLPPYPEKYGEEVEW